MNRIKPVFRPLCWLVGHRYKKYRMYGTSVEICKRCGHEVWPPFPFSDNFFKSGEIGTLEGVRFVEGEDIQPYPYDQYR